VSSCDGRDAEGNEREHCALGISRSEPDRRHEPRERQGERDSAARAHEWVHARAHRSRLPRSRDQDEEQSSQRDGSHTERSRGDDLAATRCVVQGNADEDKRLHGDEGDGNGSAAHDQDRESECDERPGERAAHEGPATQTAIPMIAATVPTARSLGTSRTRIFARSVSTNASATQRATSTTGSSASCDQTPWG
jgi:hypothetical protein